jgi:5-methylcytosine-specific restriction protein A
MHLQTWIFQGNPKRFNIDAYLQDWKNISWTIRQLYYVDQIQIGDEVFIWRSDGFSRGTGGIIARAVVTGLAEEKQDAVNEYWHTDEGLEMFMRVPLDVKEVKLEGYISRMALLEHPELMELHILKMANMTNYLISNQHGQLIRDMWLQEMPIKRFPQLIRKPRDREYKKYAEQLRDNVVYEYLFNGKSHRWLDENILDESADYSRGWFSMGMLHYLGIVDAHKGFFKGIEVIDAIKRLMDQDSEELRGIAAALLRHARNLYSNDASDESIYDEGTEYPEGKEYFRLHRLRERNPKVVKQAKELFMKKHGRLYCEVCDFDYSLAYGERGIDFIEGHHKKLISEMQEGETTKVEDIKLLCANCHRMIHRTPLISVDDLSAIIHNHKVC